MREVIVERPPVTVRRKVVVERPYPGRRWDVVAEIEGFRHVGAYGYGPRLDPEDDC